MRGVQELGLQGTQLCTNIKGKRDVKFESAICLMEALRISKVKWAANTPPCARA